MMKHLILMWLLSVDFSLHAMEEEVEEQGMQVEEESAETFVVSKKWLVTFLGYNKVPHKNKLIPNSGSIELPESRVQHMHSKTGQLLFKKKSSEFINDIHSMLPPDIGSSIIQLSAVFDYSFMLKERYIKSYALYKPLLCTRTNSHLFTSLVFDSLRKCLVATAATDGMYDINIEQDRLLTHKKRYLFPLLCPDVKYVVDTHNGLIFAGYQNGAIEYFNMSDESPKSLCKISNMQDLCCDGARSRLYCVCPIAEDALSVSCITYEPGKELEYDSYGSFDGRDSACDVLSNRWYFKKEEKAPRGKVLTLDGELYKKVYHVDCWDIENNRLLQSTLLPRQFFKSQLFKHDPITGMLVTGSNEELLFFDPYTNKRVAFNHNMSKNCNGSSMQLLTVDADTGMIAALTSGNNLAVHLFKPQLNYKDMMQATETMTLQEKMLLSDMLADKRMLPQ